MKEDERPVLSLVRVDRLGDTMSAHVGRWSKRPGDIACTSTRALLPLA